VHLRESYFFFFAVFFAVFLAAFFFIAIQPPRNGETLRRPEVAGGQTPCTVLLVVEERMSEEMPRESWRDAATVATVATDFFVSRIVRVESNQCVSAQCAKP